MICKESFIPLGHPNRSGESNVPKLVVVHYFSNFHQNKSATACADYYSRLFLKKNDKFYEKSGASLLVKSFHKIIDENTCIATIPLDEVAYGIEKPELPLENGYRGYTPLGAIYNYNVDKYAIHYALCINENWRESIRKAATIIAADMIVLGIKPINIVRHFDVTGKLCPIPFIEEPCKWYAFLEKVKTFWLDYYLLNYPLHRNKTGVIKDKAELIDVFGLKSNITLAQSQEVFLLGCALNGVCIINYRNGIYMTNESYIYYKK